VFDGDTAGDAAWLAVTGREVVAVEPSLGKSQGAAF
jgi:hypothetical protein